MTGGKPLWAPSPDRIDRANLSRFMRFVRAESGKADLNSYSPLYHFSIDQPAQFWTLLWDFVGIRGSGERTPVCVAEDGMATARWFPGVSLNFAQNLLRFDDERIAIRCHGGDGEHEPLTYTQLQRQVAALSAGLRARGLVAGDVVAAALPNTAESVVAMLACASVGAAWFACPPQLDVAANRALLARLDPKLVFVGANTRPLAEGRDAIIVGPAADAADGSSLAALLAAHGDAAADFASLPFDHPLYLTCALDAPGEILVHSAGGTLMQHLKELVLHVDLKREDKVFFHAGNDSMAWYWLVSALATGATLVLHAGSELEADGSALWDLVDEVGISVLGVHGEWLQAAARAQGAPMQTHRLLSLKTILTAGAVLPGEAYDFVYGRVKERVLLLPTCTGGDTLACLALGAPILPVWRGEVSCRALGMNVQVLDGDHRPLQGDAGDLSCCAPFPSMPLGYWGDAQNLRFNAAYFARHPGHWSGGESAVLTARESLLLGASDTVLSLA